MSGDTPGTIRALAAHMVVRATQDIDLLVEAEKADVIDAELVRLGYRRLHRSADAGNYVRKDERLELQVRGYFRLFERESQLDELLREID